MILLSISADYLFLGIVAAAIIFAIIIERSSNGKALVPKSILKRLPKKNSFLKRKAA